MMCSINRDHRHYTSSGRRDLRDRNEQMQLSRDRAER